MIFRRETSSPPCPADAPTTTCRPLSILLGQKVYIVDRRNGTTATAATSDGCPVEISLWIADPPAVSYFSVHCPGSKSTADELECEPHVVGAEGRFVLLRALFATGQGEFDYFMYRAGDGVSAASLELIPPPDDRNDLLGVCEFGIVPRGNGGHYLLAALCDAVLSLDYEIRVYSSEDERWSTKLLLNPLPGGGGFESLWTEKVITLGESVLGWVDFRKGMLVCNLLQEPPTARYIPLPELLPETRKKLESSQGGDDLQRFRDLTCTNGVIRFIEMEHRVVVWEISPGKPSDPSLKDVLYDSDLIMSQECKCVHRKAKVESMDGWRAVIWTRVIESNCWFKECAVDVDDILVDDSTCSVLLSDQRNESLGSLTFRSMYSAWPTLSMGGDDLLYLTSSLKLSGRNGRLVAVDLAKKTLKVKAFGAHSQIYRSSTLCSSSNMNPDHC